MIPPSCSLSICGYKGGQSAPQINSAPIVSKRDAGHCILKDGDSLDSPLRSSLTGSMEPPRPPNGGPPFTDPWRQRLATEKGTYILLKCQVKLCLGLFTLLGPNLPAHLPPVKKPTRNPKVMSLHSWRLNTPPSHKNRVCSTLVGALIQIYFSKLKKNKKNKACDLTRALWLEKGAPRKGRGWWKEDKFGGEKFSVIHRPQKNSLRLQKKLFCCI